MRALSCAAFAGLPVKVAQLSRMVTAKEANEVRRGLASGDINIVVGAEDGWILLWERFLAITH